MKVMHIGGSNAIHVVDQLQFLDAQGVEQCLLSYNEHGKMSDYLKSKIPVHHLFDFKKVFGPGNIRADLQKKLYVYIKRVMVIEKPDILHVHCPAYCAVPAILCARCKKLPMLVTLWGVPDINMCSRSRMRIQKVAEYCSCLNAKNGNFARAFCRSYGISPKKFFLAGYPIRLSSYTGHIPDYSTPRVYIPRSYFQEMIVYAIYKVLRSGRDMHVTLHVPGKTAHKITSLVSRLGIEDKFTYVHSMLPQEQFVESMKKHNILMSIGSDPGTSSTTMQGAYAGLVVLSHCSPYSKGILEDGVNLIKCGKVVRSIYSRLAYVIDNLRDLGDKFRENNKWLIKFDVKESIESIVGAYHSMLNKKPAPVCKKQGVIRKRVAKKKRVVVKPKPVQHARPTNRLLGMKGVARGGK